MELIMDDYKSPYYHDFDQIPFDGMLTPYAIMKHENGVFSYLRTTKPYEEEILSAGFETLEEALAFYNNQPAGVYERFVKSLQTALTTGEVQTNDSVIKGNHCRMKYRCRYAPDSRSVILISLVFLNISKFEDIPEQDRILRSFYALYDHIDRMDLKANHVDHLYININKKEIDADGGVYDLYTKQFAEEYIHPEDREDFIRHFSADALRWSFQNSSKPFTLSYFRTKNVYGKYVWKAYLNLKPADAGEDVIYSGMRPVDLATEHMLIKDNYIGLFNSLPVAYSVFQVGRSDDVIDQVTCIFASQLVSEIMEIDTEDMIGRSIFETIRYDEEIMSRFWDAAFENKSSSGVRYVPTTKKWVNITISPATKQGTAAVILDDITSERTSAVTLGREWRTDNFIINCTKFLHSDLPYQDRVQGVLERVGKASGARRVFILEAIDEDHFHETFEWCNEGVKSVIDQYQDMNKDNMIAWQDVFADTDSIIVEDIEKLRGEHPQAYRELKQVVEKNFIEIHMKDGDQILGYFGIADYTTSSAMNLSLMAESVSYFLSSEMIRRKLMEELRKTSIRDILCDVLNRNAMEQALLRLNGRHTSVGVLFADANGLKEVNDTQGHEAGDQFLKRISEILVQEFSPQAVYRAGGDEFVAIMSGIEEIVFHAKVNAVRQVFEESEGISVATGYAWSPDSMDVEKIMREADKAMYEDKAEYYKKNDRRKRKD
jgi:diguanylate cyclase (GGDEF)-like protein